MRTKQYLQRAQSAMEFLMTYGWSILPVAVVLGVLFNLGVFSNGITGVRAQPGSCKVARLQGQAPNLLGVCTGLLPQFVGYFGGTGIALPSDPSVQLTSIAAVNLTSAYTLSVWINTAKLYNAYPSFFILGKRNDNSPSGDQIGYGIFIGGQAGCSGCLSTEYYNGASVVSIQEDSSKPQISANKWYNIVVTMDSNANSFSVYLNGALNNGPVSTSGSVSNTNGNFFVGHSSCCYHSFNGTISNVQVYNSSLDSASVAALYAKGPGSAPISLKSLTLWWPLNGNPNDYSGGQNNGVQNGVVWQSTYTYP